MYDSCLDLGSPSRCATAFPGWSMYLYLASNPRVLYLATTHHDEKLGRPERVLVFRAGENPAQAAVEFVLKKDIDLNSLVRLTNRVVKGCLGLISVDNGVHPNLF